MNVCIYYNIFFVVTKLPFISTHTYSGTHNNVKNFVSGFRVRFLSPPFYALFLQKWSSLLLPDRFLPSVEMRVRTLQLWTFIFHCIHKYQHVLLDNLRSSASGPQLLNVTVYDTRQCVRRILHDAVQKLAFTCLLTLLECLEFKMRCRVPSSSSHCWPFYWNTCTVYWVAIAYGFRGLFMSIFEHLL